MLARICRAPRSPATAADATATPRYGKGGELFTWTVFDDPLKQAIVDGVVKRPLKGITKGASDVQSDIASTRYQVYLAAGVERWKEYRDQLAPLGKKPVLFVMHDTADADDIGEFLRTKYPAEFAGNKLLVIHTNKSGDVSVKDEEAAGRVAREVDDATSPVNAILSVLMLREGLGRAERGRDRRPAPVLVQGQHPSPSERSAAGCASCSAAR